MQILKDKGQHWSEQLNLNKSASSNSDKRKITDIKLLHSAYFQATKSNFHNSAVSVQLTTHILMESV